MLNRVFGRIPVATALLSIVINFLPLEGYSKMSQTIEVTAEDIRGKTLEQLTETYGTPKTVEFVLDENVDEFRVPLLNRFDKAQISGGDLVMLEATFELNADMNLTIWFHDAEYVDHYVYDKLTDF
jgi:hypothetical protein